MSTDHAILSVDTQFKHFWLLFYVNVSDQLTNYEIDLSMLIIIG